jgi:hypothetical protein
VSDISPLRQALDDAIAETGASMKDLTVLANQNDPFRIDTPARHRDGEWLAITARELGLGARTIHLRGLHYMVIGRPKPDGTPYTNTDSDWLWLSGDAGKAARWLGYIDFDQVVDQRNAAPVVRLLERKTPWPYVSARVSVDIPDVVDLEPYVGVAHFEGVQPYKLVIVGEKSSLAPVLGPVAERRQADLYLPTGCMSDTLIHTMAKVGADDGRPMAVFYFADCDPSGWNMAIEVSQKLRAFQTMLYPDLDFEVYRVGLTPDQVREYGLPSTPLKDTEKRADAWQQATGTAQTEIDALAALRPGLLRQIAIDALAPFYDSTLGSRVWRASEEWREQAQAIVDANTDQATLDNLARQLQAKLDEVRAEVDAVNDAVRVDATDFRLPEIVVPEAEVSGGNALPLLDSRWSFVDQCQALKRSKAYDSGGVS